jgi:outer membrane murein-binding lipoprotein Lpp
MKAGVPVVSDAKRRAITNALGWTPDSIDLILAGGEPVLDEPAADLVNQLAGEVATLAAVVREQANTIDRLRDDVTALQTAVRRAATSA